MKTFCIGDIHGRVEALKQVLELSKFNYDKDKLILLGDIVDGGYDTKKCVDELLKIKNLVFVRGNHDCVEENTEFLTENGWCKFKNYKGEKIATFDTDGNIYYELPISPVPMHKSKCVKIEGYNTKQIVTLNHNVIVDNKKIKAKTLLNKQLKTPQIKKSGNINNKKYNISDNLLKLIVWVVCDGCLINRNNKIHHIQFKLSKERKIKELEKLLNNLNYKYTKHFCKKSSLNKLQPYYIRIYSDYTRKIVSLLNNKKEFPIWFKQLSKKQLKIVINTLLITDGSRQNNRLFLSSINKKDIDLLQECFLTHEINSTVTKVVKGSGFKNGKQQYKLTVYLGKEYAYPLTITPVGEKNVFCFTMPRGTLITRYDGKIAFTGNSWFIKHIKSGWAEYGWLSQGGKNTIHSYSGLIEKDDQGWLIDAYNCVIPVTHQDFFNRSVLYYIDNDMLFVHGGLDPQKEITEQDNNILLWDRELIEFYRDGNSYPRFKKIFIGHSTTQNIGFGSLKPIIYDNNNKLICLDTGAGWNGKLTIMNVDTEEYWQSDIQRPAL